MSLSRLVGVGVVAWATFVWVALWEDLSVANVLFGVVVGVVSLAIFPVRQREGLGRRVRPLALLRFVAYALWSLVRSSADVAWEVVRPANRVQPGIIEVPLRTRSRTVTTIVANTVSLTPGTLTLEVRHDPPSLFVHVFNLIEIDQARAEVRRLEDLVLAAYPDVATEVANDPPPSSTTIPAEDDR